jgi:acyl-coenzyme A thioesterase PaaI-like protein
MTLGHQLLRTWTELGATPAGRARFDRDLAAAVPYTGTIEPHVLELEPGHAVVAMDDRPEVRNHLDSIHAVALMNLGEVTSGLSLLCGLPADTRAILVGLTIDYSKKARGRLLARCDCTPPDSNADARCEIVARLTDQQGDEVARVTARWAIGPV